MPSPLLRFHLLREVDLVAQLRPAACAVWSTATSVSVLRVFVLVASAVGLCMITGVITCHRHCLCVCMYVCIRHYPGVSTRVHTWTYAWYAVNRQRCTLSRVQTSEGYNKHQQVFWWYPAPWTQSLAICELLPVLGDPRTAYWFCQSFTTRNQVFTPSPNLPILSLIVLFYL